MLFKKQSIMNRPMAMWLIRNVKFPNQLKKKVLSYSLLDLFGQPPVIVCPGTLLEQRETCNRPHH